MLDVLVGLCGGLGCGGCASSSVAHPRDFFMAGYPGAADACCCETTLSIGTASNRPGGSQGKGGISLEGCPVAERDKLTLAHIVWTLPPGSCHLVVGALRPYPCLGVQRVFALPYGGRVPRQSRLR